MDIPEGYRVRIRTIKAKSGKIYTYKDLVPLRIPHRNARLVTSKSGKLYYNYYKPKGRPIRLDTWHAIRRKILGRINGHCEICGKTHPKLNVHHKDGNGNLSANPNNTPDNLIAVCPSCHMELHGLKKYKDLELIIHLRNEGNTLQNIGDIVGLSRQRISQIIKNNPQL
jgi:hypothetical protein